MLSSILRPLAFCSLTLLLSHCSAGPDIPPFTASGYLADRGVVRIWRKDDSQQGHHLQSVFTPFGEDATEITDYVWHQNTLISVERHIQGAHSQDVILRFDQQGGLSFMQRQLAGRREAVSDDTVSLYQFDAQRMLSISNALRSGQIQLKQGRWQGGTRTTDCRGEPVSLPLSTTEWQTIARESKRAGETRLAWLEAPAGIQLLLVTEEDICASEPQEDTF